MNLEIGGGFNRREKGGNGRGVLKGLMGLWGLFGEGMEVKNYIPDCPSIPKIQNQMLQ